MEKAGIPGIISCQDAALALPLVFEPGEKWDYGINIDWVGKAVERSSGQKLGDYLAEHVFAPIGLVDTVFKLTSQHRTRLAACMRATRTAASRRSSSRSHRNRSSRWAAAGFMARRPTTLHSSASF
jgi:CubicO group peptidase (beta-lactamase class C family)